MGEEDDTREHIRNFFDMVDKLQEMKVEVNKDLLSIMLLYSLPASYENFRCVIESRDDLPTPEMLKIKVIEKYNARRASWKEKSQGTMLAHKQRRQHKERSSQREIKENKQAKIVCFKCHKLGHKANECRTKSLPAEQNASKTQEVSLLITRGLAVTESTRRWCLDSLHFSYGSTSHMCGISDGFEKMERPERGCVNLASDASATVNGVGSLKLTLQGNDGDITVRLKDILYVPDLRIDLLSVSKITDNGYHIIFTREKAVVLDNEENVILTAERKDDLYFISESAEFVGSVSTRQSDDLELWHVRHGHLTC